MVLLADLGKDYRLQTFACELVVPAFVFEAAFVVAFVAASAVAYDNAFER